MEWAETGTLTTPPLVRTKPAPTVSNMENNKQQQVEKLANLLADIAFKIKGANMALTIDVLETHGGINDGKRSYTDENIQALKDFLDKQGMNNRVQQLLEDIVRALREDDLQPFFEWNMLYHDKMKQSFNICPKNED